MRFSVTFIQARPQILVLLSVLASCPLCSYSELWAFETASNISGRPSSNHAPTQISSTSESLTLARHGHVDGLAAGSESGVSGDNHSEIGKSKLDQSQLDHADPDKYYDFGAEDSDWYSNLNETSGDQISESNIETEHQYNQSDVGDPDRFGDSNFSDLYDANSTKPHNQSASDPILTKEFVTTTVAQPILTIRDEKNLLSCSKRCENLRDLPCSCDVFCMVYNNCCYDFESECPAIYSQALRIFHPDLLHSSVDCSDETGTLEVSACHLSNEKRTDMVTEGKELPVESFKETYDTFIKTAFVNRPYTDATTGIAFRNKRIYDCYATNYSVPRMWTPIVQLVHSFNIPDSLNDSHIAIDLSRVSYQAPWHTAVRKCVVSMVKSCPEVNIDPELARQCAGASISYVVDRKLDLVFKNVHCAACNSLVYPNLTLSVITKMLVNKHDFRFPVIMDIREDRIVTFLAEVRSRSLWRRLDCDIGSPNASCRLRSCADPRLKVEDNCRRRLSLFIRLDALNYHTVKDVQDLRLEFACFLEKHLSLEIDDDISETQDVSSVSKEDLLLFEFRIGILDGRRDLALLEDIKTPCLDYLSKRFYGQEAEWQDISADGQEGSEPGATKEGKGVTLSTFQTVNESGEEYTGERTGHQARTRTARICMFVQWRQQTPNITEVTEEYCKGSLVTKFKVKVTNGSQMRQDLGNVTCQFPTSHIQVKSAHNGDDQRSKVTFSQFLCCYIIIACVCYWYI